MIEKLSHCGAFLLLSRSSSRESFEKGKTTFKFALVCVESRSLFTFLIAAADDDEDDDEDDDVGGD